MHEAQRRLLTQAVPGLRRSQTYRGEGRFDGVRRPEALPVLRREVVEGEQFLPIPRQGFGGFWVLRLPSGEETCERPTEVVRRYSLQVQPQQYRLHSPRLLQIRQQQFQAKIPARAGPVPRPGNPDRADLRQHLPRW